ncbi:hypothetical protein [Paludibacter jiangxiensis]|uniref:Lipoprotein n=1 Tax=Paludibacter jiangxiensis TaxID=681398 RepID=A0A161LUC1_9BACT|nr:hypothetical protein [Paludibacter jiangxiensis]GAT62509.1 hypothetical protein PJIAN_268 [Paludibacter jiangxiensis]
MKTKIILLFFWVLLSNSCNIQTKKNFENLQQDIFDKFLSAQNNLESLQTNDIQRKEFNEKFETQLAHLIDSIGIFVNWKGEIKDIKTNEVGDFTQITFSINYKPEQYREVSFFCTYNIKTEKKDSDSLYNKLKGISDYSTVYFDGFIKRKNDDKISYDYGEMHTTYPNYQFNILDIGLTSRKDNLSTPLKNAITIDFKIINLMKQNYLKKISDREYKENTKMLNFDQAQAKLTAAEKVYSQRIRQYLVDDFMNE